MLFTIHVILEALIMWDHVLSHSITRFHAKYGKRYEPGADVINIGVKRRQNIATFAAILMFFSLKHILDCKSKKKNVAWMRVFHSLPCKILLTSYIYACVYNVRNALYSV